eukprot:6707519-Pyramimonas_sp.AAC.1
MSLPLRINTFNHFHNQGRQAESFESFAKAVWLAPLTRIVAPSPKIPALSLQKPPKRPQEAPSGPLRAPREPQEGH